MARWQSYKKELKEKAGNNDILQEAYKRFRIVLEETDKLLFEDRLSTLTQYVLQASATKRFGQYFQSYWTTNQHKCYRLNCGINTNIYVEAFHRIFKYQYLKGKHNERVDKCSLTLLKYDQGKTFDRIIKLTKGKSTN